MNEQQRIEAMRRARQVVVPVGEFKITCRRPTDLEMVDLRGKHITSKELYTQFVEGWEGVKEYDLIAGGTGDIVPFSRDVFFEWVSDHPEAWGPISGAVMDAYESHQRALEEAAKK